MDERPIVVVKVGGSLLDWPDLPRKLTDFLDDIQHYRVVLAVGGGAVADCIRALDQTHKLGDSRSHWLAIRALGVTAAILHELISDQSVLANTREDVLGAWSRGLVPILAPLDLLQFDENANPADSLPHSWDVTSDSIAARVAVLLGADRIILLKSVSAPIPLDAEQLIAQGMVDPWFHRARGRIPFDYVNLREI